MMTNALRKLAFLGGGPQIGPGTEVVDLQRLAHLVACTALDALEQTRLHSLNHAIALVIRVIMTQ